MEVVLDNKENITRAYLKLNDKNYPVYEGHNTVGRNPDAVINIKNLNVSKLHAVITIIDENTHYISDFKSSNGTLLNSKKLIPLQLYKLDNGASIKFGDVFCTYKKLVGGEVVQKSLNESQQFSDSFYVSSTQELLLPNLPDGICFNEMPTQVFTAKDVSINEMPTQVFSYSNRDGNSSNDSIDFMTMEKAESQSFVKMVGSDEKKESTVSSSQNLNFDSDTDDDLVTTPSVSVSQSSDVSSTKSSQIHPVNLNSPKIVDSDVDLNCSQVQPVKTAKKNVIESDSDSDTEEYEQFPQNNQTKYHISDDSETDIENDKNEETENKDADLETTQNDSAADFKLQLSESAECANEDMFDKPRKMSKRLLPQDHIYCQSATQSQQTQLDYPVVATEEEKSDHKEASEEPENAKNENLADSEPSAETREENEAASSLRLAETGGESNESKEEEESDAQISEKQKSDLHLDVKCSVAEETQNLDLKETDEDIFEQSTQTLDLLDEKELSHTEELKKVESDPSSVSKEDDEMFLQPTQVLETQKSKCSNSQNTDDIFLQPTQILEALHGEEEMADPVKDHSSTIEEDLPTTQTLESLLGEDANESKKEDADDVCLPPTQALEILHGEVKPTDKIEEIGEPSTSKNETDVNLVLPSTQTLELLLGDDSKPESSNKKEDDLFLPPPTDFKTPSPVKKMKLIHNIPQPEENEDDDSFILQPTQALEVMHKGEEHFNKVEDQLHEIFASQSLLCTQQLVDVLEVSRSDEIIDDSILLEGERTLNLPKLNVTSSEPTSVEAVKEILGEGLEEDRRNSLRTYSRKEERKESEGVRRGSTKQDKQGDSEKSDTDEIKGVDNADKETPVRRGRPRRNLAAEVPSDKPTTSKNENRGRQKQALTTIEEQEVIIDKNENKNKRGKRKNQDDELKTGGSGDNQNRTAPKPATATSGESGKENIQHGSSSEGREIKLGRTRRKQNVLRDDQEASTESNSQNTTNDDIKGGRRIRTRKQVTEDNLEDTKTKDQSLSETKGRGRRKQGSSNDQSSSSKTENDSSQSSINSDNGDKKRRGRTKQSSENEETEVRKGRRQTPTVQAKDDSRSSSQESARGSRRTRNTSVSSEDQFKEPEKTGFVKTGSKKDIRSTPEIVPSSNRGVNTRTNKKKEEDNEIDQTPTKKKEISEEKPPPKKDPLLNSRKRASDSEDEFVPKVPKIDTTVKKTSGRLRKPPKKFDDSSEKIISTPSTSSKSDSVLAPDEEPTKRQRRLSANSKRQKKEEESKNKQNNTMLAPSPGSTTSILATPERSRRVLKPKVVFTMMDNPELESLIRQLGGSVVDTVDACTVLVTLSVKRSLKLLCAVAQGKPICSPKWLHECKKKFAFVDPWEHILVDTEAEKKWNFSLRESINRSSKTKLLDNYTFQLIVNTGADVLKGAIESCGGKCVTRNLPKCDTDNLVIVSSENNRSKFSKIVKQNPKIIVVEAEAIFDGTLRQEFKFQDHLIT